jgi:hypothetical protein
VTDLVREATETTEETREATAGEALFPNGHEGGNNNSDPIPYFGGLTQDEVTLWKNNGTRGIEHIDDNLFAAIMHGDEVKVRSRISGADKVLSETEALILIRTRKHAEEIGYEKMLEQKLEAAEARDDDEKPWHIIGHEADMGKPRAFHLFGGCDAYGGRYDSKNARYYDRHGGSYDTKGYRFKDGSYRTAAGDHYDATTNIISLAAGLEMLVPEELRPYAAHALRRAATLRERRRQYLEALQLLQEAEKAAAGAVASATTTISRTAATGTAVAGETEIGAEPVAYATSRTASHSAPVNGDALRAALAERQADELARFEEMVRDEKFQRDASEGPGYGLGRMTCEAATPKALEYAFCSMQDNLRNGLPLDHISDSQLQDYITMEDDDHDNVVDRVRLRMTVPPLSEEANSAFRKTVKDVALTLSRLKDKAAAVFTRKTGDTYEVVIETTDEKPRLNRRKPAAIAFA